MSCNCCFEDWISNCTETLTVNCLLHAVADYTWIITDKFGNIYSGDVQSTADGQIVIDVDDLPAGLLNNYAGEFKLQIQDATCKPIKFIMASEYECVTFTVKPGTHVKDELGCYIDCITPVS